MCYYGSAMHGIPLDSPWSGEQPEPLKSNLIVAARSLSRGPGIGVLERLANQWKIASELHQAPSVETQSSSGHENTISASRLFIRVIGLLRDLFSDGKQIFSKRKVIKSIDDFQRKVVEAFSAGPNAIRQEDRNLSSVPDGARVTAQLTALTNAAKVSTAEILKGLPMVLEQMHKSTPLNSAISNGPHNEFNAPDYLTKLVTEFYQDAKLDNWIGNTPKTAVLSVLEEKLSGLGVGDTKEFFVKLSLKLLKNSDLAGTVKDRILHTLHELNFNGGIFSPAVLEVVLHRPELVARLHPIISKMDYEQLIDFLQKTPLNHRQVEELASTCISDRSDVKEILAEIDRRSDSADILVAEKERLDIALVRLLLNAEAPLKPIAAKQMVDLLESKSLPILIQGELANALIAADAKLARIYFYNLAKSTINNAADSSVSDTLDIDLPLTVEVTDAEIGKRVLAVEKFVKSSIGQKSVTDLMSILKTSNYPDVRVAALSALCSDALRSQGSLDILNRRLEGECPYPDNVSEIKNEDPVLLHTILHLSFYDDIPGLVKNKGATDSLKALFERILSLSSLNDLKGKVDSYNETLSTNKTTSKKLNLKKAEPLEKILGAETIFNIVTSTNSNLILTKNCIELLGRLEDRTVVKALANEVQQPKPGHISLSNVIQTLVSHSKT